MELDAFANGGEAALEKACAVSLPEYDVSRIIACEDTVMEMTPTAHPMGQFREAARERGAVTARAMPHFAGRLVTLAGFLVTRRRAPTKGGGMMEFATLEDETDIFEVTLFPDAYRRYGRLLRSAGPFLVKGKVEDQFGSLTVTAAYIDYLLDEQRRPRYKRPPKDDDAPEPGPVEPQLFIGR